MTSEQLFIPTNKGIKVVTAGNIIRVEASSNYCRVYFSNDEPLTVAKLLHWFEKRLPETYFYRIHRTHIVNRMFISHISLDNRLTLINGEQVQTSRRKRGVLKQMMALFMS